MRTPSDFERAAARFADQVEHGPVIRAVNIHNTPRSSASRLEAQLEGFTHDFSSVNEEELDAYLATGVWRKPKPGLILAVYEGYRNGFDVLLPLLDRYGWVGWFFVITGFIDTPPSRQFEFAAGHDIDMTTREYERDGRYAMTWEELRTVGTRHVIASHTRTHVSLAGLGPAARESEVLGAQRDLETHLGRPARAFASLGGPAYGVDPATDAWIDRAGYQFVFSNLRIQRLRPTRAA